MQITKTTKTVEVVTKVEEPRFTISDLTIDDMVYLCQILGLSTTNIARDFTGNKLYNSYPLFSRIYDALVDSNKVVDQNRKYTLVARNGLDPR